MREIRTSGLMSGEGKRSDANAVQTTAPFLDSTQGQARHRAARSRSARRRPQSMAWATRKAFDAAGGPPGATRRAADIGRQAASKRLPDARVLTCTMPRYVGRPCVVVRQGARRAVMLGASQAPGNAAGGRARPPCGSRFPPPRGVGNALRCQGIAVTPPTAEETGNAILRAVESCKGVLASRRTLFLACRPISAVPHLSLVRKPG